MCEIEPPVPPTIYQRHSALGKPLRLACGKAVSFASSVKRGNVEPFEVSGPRMLCDTSLAGGW